MLENTHHTEESKAKMHKSHSGWRHSAETKAKMSITRKGRKLSEETKTKMRQYKLEHPLWLGKKLSEEHKAKISLSLIGNKRMVGKHLSPETKDKMSIARSGVNSPNFGKHWKMSPEARAKMSKSRTGMVSGMLGKHHKPETKIIMSQINKLKNLNLEFKDRRIKASRLALNQFPNKPESTVMNLLNELYPSEWKYTGDGDVILGGQNPDFMNINGEKKIVELFGDYWHTVRARAYKDTESGKTALYKSYGYDTLIIWEKELKDTEKVKGKLKVFCEA